MNKELKRMIIQSHTTSKNNFCLEAPKGYLHIAPNTSATCTDKWDIYLKINNDVIEDVKYTGNGCAISTASLSILSELLISKSLVQAKEIISEYTKMIKGETFDESLLGELIVFDNVHSVWNRVECALIGSNAIKKTLGGENE